MRIIGRRFRITSPTFGADDFEYDKARSVFSSESAKFGRKVRSVKHDSPRINR